MIMCPQEWLGEDETAGEMLDRVQPERPFLLPSPLHRVPLRVGNVLEIVGPSPSSKTHILIQAAISCILPVEWNGIKYGGLGHVVMFFDLDGRFDISRFSDLLQHRISEANGFRNQAYQGGNEVEAWNCNANMKPNNEEVFVLCMKRFLYTSCHESFEFLATLKTLNYRLPKERDAHGFGVRILMIDSIGAFHWADRVLSTFSLEGYRKILSLQSMSETVVQEIRKLLHLHPMLVIATKATILYDRYSDDHQTKWNFGKHSLLDHSLLRNAASSNQELPYREYMPSIWQSLITHRMLVRPTDDKEYQSEWIKPPLHFLDKFLVKDAGLFLFPQVIWGGKDR